MGELLSDASLKNFSLFRWFSLSRSIKNFSSKGLKGGLFFLELLFLDDFVFLKGNTGRVLFTWLSLLLLPIVITLGLDKLILDVVILKLLFFLRGAGKGGVATVLGEDMSDRSSGDAEVFESLTTSGGSELMSSASLAVFTSVSEPVSRSGGSNFTSCLRSSRARTSSSPSVAVSLSSSEYKLIL